jgi:hypothetical protein
MALAAVEPGAAVTRGDWPTSSATAPARADPGTRERPFASVTTIVDISTPCSATAAACGPAPTTGSLNHHLQECVFNSRSSTICSVGRTAPARAAIAYCHGKVVQRVYLK